MSASANQRGATSPLRITGLGLCSPSGLTPRDHAYLLRAERTLNGASAFVDHGGEPVASQACSWLPLTLSLEDRLVRLACRAAESALDVYAREATGGAASSVPGSIVWALVLPPPRPELPADALARVADRVKAALEAHTSLVSSERASSVLHGVASTTTALSQIQQGLSGGRASAGLVISVDSAIDPAFVGRERFTVTPWEREHPPWAEGAAAVRFDHTSTPIANLAAFGALPPSATSACDHNDLPADGAQLTALLRHLFTAAGVGNDAARLARTLGPHQLDQLRHRLWCCAVPRIYDALDPVCLVASLEEKVGRLGAAAMLSELVYACAIGDAPYADRQQEPAGRGAALVWAVGKEGTRAGAVLKFEQRQPAPALDLIVSASAVSADPNSAVVGVSLPINAELQVEDPSEGTSLAPIKLVRAEPALDGAAESVVEPNPAVVLDPERAPAASVADFYRLVCAAFVQEIGVLLRDHEEGPLEWRQLDEPRILARRDALASLGAFGATTIVSVFRDAVSQKRFDQGEGSIGDGVVDPTLTELTAAVAFLLASGSPARGAHSELESVLGTSCKPVGIHPAAVGRAVRGGLAVSAQRFPARDRDPRTEAAVMGQRLVQGVAQDTPADEAISVLVLALHLGHRVEPKSLLSHASAMVRSRAWVALAEDPALHRQLMGDEGSFDLVELEVALAASLDAPDPIEVLTALEFAIVFNRTKMAQPRGWRDQVRQRLVQRSGYAQPLGVAGLRLWVSVAEASDAEAFMKAAKMHQVSAELLDVVARFGDPRVWKYLAHHLNQPAHSESAAQALVTLFGPRLAADEIRFGKWKAAIMDFHGEMKESGHRAGEVRFRYGQPLGLHPLLDEAGALPHPLPQLRARLTDVRAVAASAPFNADLAVFSDDIDATAYMQAALDALRSGSTGA